jgi:nicotinate-nucleotide adenylyltransferase
VRELGVFCGTFNPVHWGHLLVAEEARIQFHLEKVLLITSPNPPHRTDDLLDAEDRYAMVAACCSDNPCFEASRLELDRSGSSYTVDTLGEIARSAGNDCRLNLIIGQDNVQYLSQWHDSERLLSMCRLLVAPRFGEVESVDLPDNVDMVFINLPAIPVSSTVIRDRLRKGRSVRYLVHPAAFQLLIEKRHYLRHQVQQQEHSNP